MRSPLAVALIGWTVLLPASDSPTFHTSVALVKADVEVYDRRTRSPILGLNASDFTVHDEDQTRDIVYFGDDSGPLDVLLLLDVSGSVREILPQIAACATDALSALGEEDRAAVMAFSKTTALAQSLTLNFLAVAEGIRATLSLRIGLDTDINQAVCSAANYLHDAGGTSRRAVLVITDNMQETSIPDPVVDEQLTEAGAVLDGLLVRGPMPLPHVGHPGILGFARSTGGEVIEGNRPSSRLAEMIRRIKFRYSIHFRPVETQSPRPRRIHIALTAEARRRYPYAVVRARRIYFPRGTYRPKPNEHANQRIAFKPAVMPAPHCS
jgi:hypothetical protein